MAGKKGAKWRTLKPWSPAPGAATAKENYLYFAKQQERRFWAKARRAANGCLEWTGGLDKDGYGKFQITLPRLEKHKQQQCHMRAHRLAYELTHGPVADGQLVLHSCDNPKCIDPDHLSAGTQLQNRREAVARGRVPFGERHNRAKLTERQAQEVICQRDAGVAARDIAGRLGIAQVTVYQIGRLIWKHLA